MRLNPRRHWFWMAPVAVLGIALVIFIGGEIVKQLWNWLMPPIFGLREVTFWQAFGLLALCRVLFGGFGRHGAGRYGRSTEEREHLRQRIRQRVRERCGFDPPAGGPAPTSGAASTPPPS
jgi:hypothetical protein